MAKPPVYINVKIDPAVRPYVDATLTATEKAADAWEALMPHLAGAWGSLSQFWPDASPRVRAALLAKSPRLRKAMGLRRRLATLLAQMPEIEDPADGN